MPHTFGGKARPLIVAALGFVGVATLQACKEAPSKTHHRAAIEAFKNGEYAKAGAEYDQVYALDPKIDERVQEKGAQAWANAGNYDNAAAILERLANGKQGQERIEMIRKVASIYMKGNDLEKAETWFGKALALNPKDDVTISWLGEIASTRGGARSATAPANPEQLDLALKYYDDALALNPNRVGYYVNKRVIYLKYLDFLKKQGEQATADAEASKKDKKAQADLLEEADTARKRFDATKLAFDAANEKISELNKAAKAAAVTAPSK